MYVDTRQQQDFDLCRFGWVGDYMDPNTFLDMWVTDGGINASGWSNNQYDSFIQQAAKETNPAKRFEHFQAAEAILLEELPIIPIYFYTSVYLKHLDVKNWHSTILDHHPYKHVVLDQ